jgi:hypothetical protein
LLHFAAALAGSLTAILPLEPAAADDKLGHRTVALGQEPVREHVGQPRQRFVARENRAVPGQVGAVHVVGAAAVDGATPQTSLIKQSGEG